ncbi:MAG: thioredoxin domain-containing protein [Sphingomonadales bacterium]
MKANPKHTNALIHAGSPYLLQHAHNPVNWIEWHSNLWEQAQRENKPVLISVGYSACHWCHVMEKECFEDEKTAELMNTFFINVKVDREERPDIDMVYMDACQLMTGRGGWPLNVFCLPDGSPVYAGTYFPIDKWQQVLLQIHSLWTHEKDKALEYAAKVMGGLKSMNDILPHSSPFLGKSELPGLYEKMAEGFDWEEGGPNRVPKFPLPNQYELLLDYYLQTGHEEALDFTHLSLLKMANGGIYDHLRGGFCRYSTDGKWFAPHFEKMLYDNAQLISLYSRAHAISDAPLYKEIATECIQFCLNELYDGHAFHSALDADSEGVEGKFYVFSHAELEQCLNSEELEFAKTIFSCTEPGNWEHGQNILYRKLAPLQVLETLNIDVGSYTALLRTVKQKLRDFQDLRPRPGLDNKIIAAWNGLMLKALADAGLCLKNPDFIRQAEMLASWMQENLWQNRELFRIYSREKASIPAFLEDYACFTEGLITLYSATGKMEYAHFAKTLAEKAIQKFRDPETGTFYFTPSDGEPLILRKTDLADDVMNSSVSVMAHSLCKLGTIFQKQGFIAMGMDLLGFVKKTMLEYPGWYSNWGRLALAGSSGFIQVACCGPGSDEAAKKLCFTLPAHAQVSFAETQSELPQFTGKKMDSLHIYVCLGETCLEPVHSAEQAIDMIQDLISLNQ